MSDNVKVNGPVSVSNDSKERVAYEMMSQIYIKDSENRDHPDPKTYILKLYQDCLNIVKGGDADYILSSRKSED